MNRILMIALVSLVTGISILQAQTVSTITLGGNQYPVVDLTELTPLGCVLTKKECDERRTAMYAKTPNAGSMISDNDQDGAWNKKMSSKFQVMTADYSGGATKIWVDAWNGCRAYTGASDGGGSQAEQWRLPTQKELKMILVLYPQLLEQGGISAFSADYYWSSTESNTTYAWYVHFSFGFSNRDYPKSNSYRVRCIRDL
ncbi:Lcl C-terminal domain-containing protein [Parabacteroides sp.]